MQPMDVSSSSTAAASAEAPATAAPTGGAVPPPDQLQAARPVGGAGLGPLAVDSAAAAARDAAAGPSPAPAPSIAPAEVLTAAAVSLAQAASPCVLPEVYHLIATQISIITPSHVNTANDRLPCVPGSVPTCLRVALEYSNAFDHRQCHCCGLPVFAVCSDRLPLR